MSRSIVTNPSSKPSPFYRLPDDCIGSWSAFLGVRGFVGCARVCHKFAVIIRTSAQWQPLARVILTKKQYQHVVVDNSQTWVRAIRSSGHFLAASVLAHHAALTSSALTAYLRHIALSGNTLFWAREQGDRVTQSSLESAAAPVAEYQL